MAKIRICLDAGHYGKYNRSPANKNYYESDMSWKLHLLLKKHLETYGIEVITTRPEQAKDLALLTRGKKSKGCDLFISLHSNAVGSKVDNNVDYPITYYPVSGKGKDLATKLSQCIASVMGTKQKAQAKCKKGSYGDYYGVIRGAVSVGTVGLLIEHSFHTNTRSTNWLLIDSNLEKLAKAEAEAIAKHYGLSKTSQNAPDRATSDFKPYKVKVICESLNIRRTPKWGAGDVVGTIKDKGTYTIVAETNLEGTKFGKLKSGAGWISLGSKYVKKV